MCVLRADITALTYAITRLLRAGLLVPPSPSSSNDPRPSFFTPIFPSLLRHLSPSPSAVSNGSSSTQPAERYPEGFWPRILLEMQQSDITALTWSFVLHLTRHHPPNSTKIHHASSILQAFLGPSVEPPSRGKGKQKDDGKLPQQRTSEVYDAFVDGLLTRGKGRETGEQEAVEVRCRVVVEWVAKGGEVGMFCSCSSNGIRVDGRARWLVAVKDLIERVLETWTDPKSIKYSLFAWQLCKSPSFTINIADQLPNRWQTRLNSSSLPSLNSHHTTHTSSKYRSNLPFSHQCKNISPTPMGRFVVLGCSSRRF
jgi:telomere length regulation protein